MEDKNPVPANEENEIDTSVYDALKAEENEETVLKAWYWEGPYASMYVPEEKKTAAVFPFSEEGISQAVAWLNEAAVNF